MPFGINDLDKVFAVADLLDDREGLVAEFRPEVEKYLVRDNFFKGPFRKAYENAFEDLIVRLIKREIIKHFPSYTPEDVLLLSDKGFLRMISDDYYFNPKIYSKEGK